MMLPQWHIPTERNNMSTHYAQDDVVLAERDARQVDEYRESLRSGRTLALAAASHRSRFGYMPPIGHRQWSHTIETLGRMARESDALAQIASAIVGRLNLYGDNAQLCTSVYSAAFEAVTSGYDDVVGRTGPEAGRWSQYHRSYSLREIVSLHYWLILACKGATSSVDRPGWCLQIVAETVGGSPWHVRKELGLDI
jgi:hypothetical protein